MKTEVDEVPVSQEESVKSSKKNIQFGPTWLKQFSPHENSKDSPDVAFQLAKHRYGTEEMLSIYENIEKCLFKLPVPVGFTTDFEELYKKDIQEPVLLSSETEEEKKCFSTCVNSQLALNAFNKLHGQFASSSSSQSSKQTNGESSASRGSAPNSTRGSRGSSFSNRGNRGKNQEEETSSNNNKTSSRGGFGRGSYSRTSANTSWKERKLESDKELEMNAAKKEQSKASWRSSDKESSDKEYQADFETKKEKHPSANSDKSVQSKKYQESQNEKPSYPKSTKTPSPDQNNNIKSLKSDSGNKERMPTRTQQKSNNQNLSENNRSNNQRKESSYRERKPEWLDEDVDNFDFEDSKLPFDESGKYVYKKESDEDKKREEKSKTISKKTEIEKNKTQSIKKSESSTSHSSIESKKSSPSKSPLNDLSKLKEIKTESEKQPEIPPEPVIPSPSQLIVESSQDKIEKPVDQVENPLLNDFKRIAETQQQSIIGAERWFFIDSQNQIQGSFSSEQMAAWFAAGYFSMNLMIKRAKDDKFLPLSVYISNYGRIPFITESQLKQQHFSQQKQIQQMENFNLLQSQLLASQQQSKLANNFNTSPNLLSLSQQLQQLQLQQKAALASMNQSLQHESLVNQFNLPHKNLKLNSSYSLNDQSIIDPAILDASLHSLRSSANLNNPLTAHLMNNLLVNQNQFGNQLNQYPALSKEKIQMLLEEEKRRKMEEIQLKIKLKEEKRLIEEIRFKQQEELKRLEEQRLKEELRKEMQRKKLEEIIKKQEEDKKNNEKKLKKQIDEQKIKQLYQMKQEQLNKLKFQSQAGYQNDFYIQPQFSNEDLKAFLEQQALEQKILMDRFKQ